MSKKKGVYNKGDWIVHAYYGVGQIKKVEKKEIEGKKKSYFRVKSLKSIFWIPLNRSETNRIRPVVHPSTMYRALRTIRETPEQMENESRSRKKRFTEVKEENSIIQYARLIRDLHGREKQSRLNLSEKDAMQFLLKRFTNELSVSLSVDMKEAENILSDNLQKSFDIEVNE